MSEAKENIFFKIWKNFLYGILVISPIYLTVYIVYLLIVTVDSTIKDIFPSSYFTFQFMPFPLPGIGIIVAFLVFTVIGYLAKGFLGKFFIRIGEDILNKMPIIRNVYSTFKQIFETVLKKDKNSFKKVVLVEYPRKGIWSLGFVTGITKGEVQYDTTNQVLNVFIPTTPNPTSGFLLFVSQNEIKNLTMSVEEGIKMVISAGMITPKVK